MFLMGHFQVSLCINIYLKDHKELILCQLGTMVNSQFQIMLLLGF